MCEQHTVSVALTSDDCGPLDTKPTLKRYVMSFLVFTLSSLSRAAAILWPSLGTFTAGSDTQTVRHFRSCSSTKIVRTSSAYNLCGVDFNYCGPPGSDPALKWHIICRVFSQFAFACRCDFYCHHSEHCQPPLASFRPWD